MALFPLPGPIHSHGSGPPPEKVVTGTVRRREAVFVRHDNPRDQMVDVVHRLHLGRRLHSFTRCMACNGRLEDVDKALVAERLTPRTRRGFDDFRRCPDCDRLYWAGSHHRR